MNVKQNHNAPTGQRMPGVGFEARHERAIRAPELLHEQAMAGMDHSAAPLPNDMAGKRASHIRPATDMSTDSSRPACTPHTRDSRACKMKVSPCRPTRCRAAMNWLNLCIDEYLRI